MMGKYTLTFLLLCSTCFLFSPVQAQQPAEITAFAHCLQTALDVEKNKDQPSKDKVIRHCDNALQAMRQVIPADAVGEILRVVNEGIDKELNTSSAR